MIDSVPFAAPTKTNFGTLSNAPTFRGKEVQLKPTLREERGSIPGYRVAEIVYIAAGEKFNFHIRASKVIIGVIKKKTDFERTQVRHAREGVHSNVTVHRMNIGLLCKCGLIEVRTVNVKHVIGADISFRLHADNNWPFEYGLLDLLPMFALTTKS